MAVACATSIDAQQPAADAKRLTTEGDARATATERKDSSWVQPALVRRDWRGAAFVGLTTLAAMPFDRAVHEEFRDPSPQSSTFLRKNASAFNFIGSPGVLIASAAMWGAGKLSGKSELVKLGGHSGAAIVASGVVTTGLKFLIGRQRPFVENEAYDFTPLHGTRAGRSSLPSGHTTAAFAFASAIATDLRYDHPNGARWGVPLLYLGAASVGAARMYDNKHWFSDVVMGAGIGTLIGHRTVTYSRSHPTSWLGRHINGFSVAPSVNGLTAAVSVR